ncbi:MAG TPA: peroxidase-related enzyme [Ilumatobacteraceae bacterium]|nr:peroxidase-related enzyme [Ilumatobacteraceae bacterium]
MFIEVPEESAVGADVADWYQRQRKAWGYLPNYAPAFATRPDVAEAWNTLNNAVRGHMDRRRFELATIAAARVYRSTYCMAAHCKFLRDACDDESTMRAVAADPSGATLDATDRAVMDFATQVARDASSVTAADVQRLRDNGLGDPEIVDVVLAAAARAFFTKVLDALGVQADVQLGETFDPEVRHQVTVGRPIADS